MPHGQLARFHLYLTCRGKGDYQIDYKPAPRISEADKTNDQRYQSLD